MRSQLFVTFALLAVGGSAPAAETEYLGLYLNGSKVGYSSFVANPSTLHGHKATKTISITKIAMEVLGTETKVSIAGTTYVDKLGRPIQMTFDQSSGGRTQHVVADFGKSIVKLKVNNSGNVSYMSLPIPKGGHLVDDPMNGLVFGHTKAGHTSTVVILDPTTVSFVTNTIVFKGKAAADVHGHKVTAEWVQIQDPRATTDVYFKANGDLVKVNGALGFEMFPESRALAMSQSRGDAKVDLAIGSKITPVGTLRDPANLKGLSLGITVEHIGSLPSDDHQSAKKTPHGWSVAVHPPTSAVPSGFSISQTAQGRSEWIKPDLNVPSNSPRFVKLAKSIVGSETDVAAAAKKIQLYVNGKMQPDASIAVLRDANEVLDSCRGVCRDYAILTATLMRAAGIPTKLVTGLVSWDGDFYYHAWVSIFDGKNWVGVDSTTSDVQISAAHVELAVGTVGQAFNAPVLQHAIVKVVSSR